MSWLCSFALLSWLGWCSAATGPELTGYVEGEYIWIAPVFTARIEQVLAGASG